MSDMKCPFCQQELYYFGNDIYYCPNHEEYMGNEELWQSLIDTKKKLDIALKELKASDKYYQDDECIKEAIKKIEQINQKEEK